MRDMIVFGEDFGGLPSSTQHLIRNLPQMRKIIWVNSIGLRQPKLNSGDCYRAMSKLFGQAKRGFCTPSQVPDNVHIVNLRTIPAPGSQISRQLARSMMLQQLLPILEQHHIDKPILWSSLPTAADLCGHLNESGVIYYCGDDFSALSGVDHDVVTEHEHKMVKKANIIFGASEAICAKFPYNKTVLLPHGVDLELFSQPVPKADDFPTSGRPVAGFYGSLSNWLDYDLINLVALNLPGWDFIFVGPNEMSYNPLPKLSNVHYLGPRPHHQLPRYSQHWQASLLPFKSNRQIQACNPLKLLEYLAAGSPIVATPFPALDRYNKYINIVDNAHEMSEALKITTYEAKRSADIVASDSWRARSQFVRSLLDML
ncbi:putative glycosyltransferase [Vibrio ichthyoenteri ATCC 700023]|uniref:Putative glycosyltransferase n=1 Tax=Vibrio ichthyoenteri ATCC 700023 TaxID=870968 RepID=F9RZQ2_9VIBR|nr:glycosyltransferase [Vibrio ichthyoenteri]EGU44460.1 putative glycosyltransferase [Vibrio ichthyoenteri ATCC 700023]